MAASEPGTGTRGRLTFRFRGRTVALDRFAPRTTLLDWLREEAGAKGTKEGCGEGDCGACTVVLSRLQPDGALSYEPVNACILLLGQVDGAEVLTVEDLADGQRLHPVQQAMVDHHGSQCGFCTPGIVMSLFALYHQREAATYAERVRRARRQSLPLHRLSADHRRGAGDLRRQAGRPLRRNDRRARRGAGGARRRARSLRRRRRTPSSPRRRAKPRSPRFTPAIPARRWSAARPTSGCGSPSSCATSSRSSGSAASPDSTRSRRGATRCASARARRCNDAAPHLAATPSRPRRTDAPLRLAPGARERHGRRQHRQRLADRRSRAGADRARRAGRAQAAAARRASCRSRTSSSPMASRIAARANTSAPSSRRGWPPTRPIAPSRSPSGSTRTFPP